MSRIELRLPDFGLDDQPISLSNWLVSGGAHVAEGEPLAEILAGPATVDLPSPAAGILIKRLVDIDEPLSAGQVLAVIETDAVS
jgi:pyruvate/2-oxoglutarate dehydrogenase complex dihydrolipoamide acyltransferase (E2) component